MLDIGKMDIAMLRKPKIVEACGEFAQGYLAMKEMPYISEKLATTLGIRYIEGLKIKNESTPISHSDSYRSLKVSKKAHRTLLPAFRR